MADRPGDAPDTLAAVTQVQAGVHASWPCDPWKGKPAGLRMPEQRRGGYDDGAAGGILAHNLGFRGALRW